MGLEPPTNDVHTQKYIQYNNFNTKVIFALPKAL